MADRKPTDIEKTLANPEKAEREDEKRRKEAEKEQAKRKQPDKPVGQIEGHEEQDFYERQRAEDPDGMTPEQRDQWQKSAPGALGQKSPDGEQLGLSEDEANPEGGKEQSRS